MVNILQKKTFVNFITDVRYGKPVAITRSHCSGRGGDSHLGVSLHACLSQQSDKVEYGSQLILKQ